jgi:hypothetical protein
VFPLLLRIHKLKSKAARSSADLAAAPARDLFDWPLCQLRDREIRDFVEAEKKHHRDRCQEGCVLCHLVLLKVRL